MKNYNEEAHQQAISDMEKENNYIFPSLKVKKAINNNPHSTPRQTPTEENRNSPKK